MYQEYWQLDQKPFEPVGDTAAYYPCEAQQGALLKLRYTIEQRRPAVVLAGPGGVGKTLLVQRLLAELPQEISPVARVVFPQMGHRDLLAYLADRFGAPAAAEPRYTVDESIQRIEQRFEQNNAEGKHALLVIDEAHLLEDTGLLETVRLLLNLGDGMTPPMTVLLVGQMGLISALGRTPGLEQRVAVKSLLRPFTLEEVGDYVRHRLQAAGATRELFTPEAIQMLHALTGGVARRIDRLADLALVVGFADGLPSITDRHIESVSQELLTVTPE